MSLTTPVPSAGTRGRWAGPSFPALSPSKSPSSKLSRRGRLRHSASRPGSTLASRGQSSLLRPWLCDDVCPAGSHWTGRGTHGTLFTSTGNAARGGQRPSGWSFRALLPLAWAVTTDPHRPRCSRDEAKWGGICWSEPGEGPGSERDLGEFMYNCEQTERNGCCRPGLMSPTAAKKENMHILPGLTE